MKAGLLDLLDDAAEHGGSSTARACRLLGLDPDRAADGRARRALDRLADLAPGGAAVHGLLDTERTAILELFEAWAEIDRSHRKLAARGSRLDLVHVVPSTIRRVLHDEGFALPGLSPREPTVRAPWPHWIVWKPNSIWCYDFTHFPRASCAAIAVMDVVSRRWFTTLVSAEETSTQVEVAFTDALYGEGLAERIDARLLAQLRPGTIQPVDLDGPEADGVPVLIVTSDNGPQMRSHLRTKATMVGSQNGTNRIARSAPMPMAANRYGRTLNTMMRLIRAAPPTIPCRTAGSFCLNVALSSSRDLPISTRPSSPSARPGVTGPRCRDHWRKELEPTPQGASRRWSARARGSSSLRRVLIWTG